MASYSQFPTQIARSQNRDPMDEVGIRLCKTSPKFLESNATSHTWAFSAVAELIDNAYDPDVRATQMHIGQRTINGESCLLFIDDGNGLSEDQLYRMLSFGYSDKPENADYKPIGRYGNGFKSGSMRLGKDALVLTKQATTLSVGFLSQTFHTRTNADTVRIPIVVFDRGTLQLAEPVEQNKANLRAILEHSIFNTEDELMDQLTVVPDFDQDRACGTKIIIWNLREISQGRPELYFRRDIHDIVCNDSDCSSGPSVTECPSSALDFEHSLRKYCGILYLRPRMKIFIMDDKVRSRLITKDLSKTETDRYTMKGERPVTITLGFDPKNGRVDGTNDFGVMMYHKNRLIKPFEKVGYQKQSNGSGRGVVCVIEADFLTPNHNKQGFVIDEKYHRVMNAVGKKVNEYWDVKMNPSAPKKDLNESLDPDCTWVQCDQCLKWRRLPDGDSAKITGEWYCTMHPRDEIASQGCRAVEDKLTEGEIDLDFPSAYRQEKVKAVKRKKTQSFSRSRAVRDESSFDSNERETRSKQRRTESPRRAALVTDVRQKVKDLKRQAQSLLAEPPVVVGSVADALHQDRRRDNDQSQTVLCVNCQAWKKLPAEVRVDDVNAWECKMHPDESQRQCQSPGDNASDRSSPSDEYSNQMNEAGPSGMSANRGQSSSSASVEFDCQGPPATVPVDGDGDGDEQERENNEDITALQRDVNQLATVFSKLKRASTKVKPETCASACQTEVDALSETEHAQFDAARKENEDLKEKLEEARRDVAKLLSIILEDQSDQPAITADRAFEVVKQMLQAPSTKTE